MGSLRETIDREIQAEVDQKMAGVFSDEEFKELWNSAGSAAEAAAKLMTARDAASNRARRLRNKGYSLQRFKKGINYSTKVKDYALDLAASKDPIYLVSEIRQGIIDKYGVSPTTATVRKWVEPSQSERRCEGKPMSSKEAKAILKAKYWNQPRTDFRRQHSSLSARAVVRMG